MEVVASAQALRDALRRRGARVALSMGEHRAPLSQVVRQWNDRGENSAMHENEVRKLRKRLILSVRSLCAPEVPPPSSPPVLLPSKPPNSKSGSSTFTSGISLPTPIPPALHQAMRDALVRGGDAGANIPSAKALLSAVMFALEQERNNGLFFVCSARRALLPSQLPHTRR